MYQDRHVGWSLKDSASLRHGEESGTDQRLRVWNVQEGLYLHMKPSGLSVPSDLTSVRPSEQQDDSTRLPGCCKVQQGPGARSGSGGPQAQPPSSASPTLPGHRPSALPADGDSQLASAAVDTVLAGVPGPRGPPGPPGKYRGQQHQMAWTACPLLGFAWAKGP